MHGTTNIKYRVHNIHDLVPITSQINPIHLTVPYKFNEHMNVTPTYPFFPSRLFILQNANYPRISAPPYSCHIPPPSPNNSP